MANPASVRAQYAAEIKQAASRFSDHEGMSQERVLAWMAQFDDNHLPLADRILERIQYFSTSDVRRMTRGLAQLIIGQFGGDPRRVIFVPIEDHPGSSGSIVARVLFHLPLIRGSRVVKLSDLEGMQKGTAEAVAFVDDFSGTGEQFEDWWLTVEPLVRPLGIPVVVGLLVMTAQARGQIQQFASHVLAVSELNGRYNVLSDECTDFDALEKTAILGYCQRTRCEQKYLRGYGSCGLLMAFMHGCPDNSLPIIWYDMAGWQTLFIRHAI